MITTPIIINTSLVLYLYKKMINLSPRQPSMGESDLATEHIYIYIYIHIYIYHETKASILINSNSQKKKTISFNQKNYLNEQ
jgi:hypothetical protein